MRAHPVQAGLGDRRRRLLAAARGRVLDVGGYVHNGPHYPPGVDVHDIAVEEVDGLDTAPFDTVVCTLVLCTVDDLRTTLAGLRARLAADGRLLFIEHVRGGALRSVGQRVARPLWQQAFSGCRPDRDTVAAVRAAGFLITDLDRFTVRLAAPVVSPAVQGVAKKAAST
ncbi:MAG: methyltransferase domain-containing protein [Actinobacteria bacterium]|nr:methyltransferase domain-containing protein [Actinomycetota bacterium]